MLSCIRRFQVNLCQWIRLQFFYSYQKTFGEKITLAGIIYQPEANYTSQNNQTINTINPNGNFGGDSEIIDLSSMG